MIIDAQQLERNTEISGRIAIIGAGAAGITLAIELAKHFKDVVVLESGGLEFEQETQDLYKGRDLRHSDWLYVPDRLDHPETFLDASRLRYFGGTTNHWAGLCAPLDIADFEHHADQPYGGWPFQLDDLVPFYKRAYSYCEIGAYRKEPTSIGVAEPTARRLLDSSDFELAEFRRSSPTRFGERYRSDLATSDRVRVYLHSNVSDILISSNGKAISSLEVRTLNGRTLTATAAAYILCCGGIENARVLLNCTRHFPSGIANEHDLVGRFFMNNPMVGIGTVMPKHIMVDLGSMYLGEDGVVPITVVFKNSAATTRRPGRRGASIFLTPIFETDSALAKARGTPAFEAVQTMLQEMKRGRIPTNFADKACTVLEDTGSVALASYHRMTRLFQKDKPIHAIHARVEGAQHPNPDSRVTLNDDVDALGLRRATLDWRITDEDYDNLYQTSIAFARGVGAAGFGRMILEITADKNLSKIVDTGHHIGTTRMNNNPRLGVVDQNCQAHGLENFFIAGSSIFPTGPRVNPTLTIVALAIRLAEHLSTKLQPT